MQLITQKKSLKIQILNARRQLNGFMLIATFVNVKSTEEAQSARRGTAILLNIGKIKFRIDGNCKIFRKLCHTKKFPLHETVKMS